jgi:glutamine amidotransferase
MRIAVVDFGAGNLRSVAKALAVVGGPEARVAVTASAAEVAAADRIVLPGDGAFPDCRRALDEAPGLVEALETSVRRRAVPFLGICVGMQLLADVGHEFETTPGLGWIAGACIRVAPADPRLKVPHMGWNTLERRAAHPLLDGLPLGPDGLHAYFLHGWRFEAADSRDVVATADHGGPIAAVIARGNVAGTQFHPEKSQRLGLGLLARFLAWRP